MSMGQMTKKIRASITKEMEVHLLKDFVESLESNDDDYAVMNSLLRKYGVDPYLGMSRESYHNIHEPLHMIMGKLPYIIKGFAEARADQVELREARAKIDAKGRFEQLYRKMDE
jgi:hypothetical protein